MLLQFLSPRILVRKGGILPEGHINDWFWEKKDPISHLKQRLPGKSAEHASQAPELNSAETAGSRHTASSGPGRRCVRPQLYFSM